MAKRSKVRFTKNDRTEYQRLRRNATAKINRTLKKFGVDLSQEVRLPRGISSFTTRKEFNEWKDELKRFTNPDNWKYQFVKNEHGVVISKKELRRIELDNQRAIRNARKVIDKVAKQPFIQGGEQYGTVGKRLKQMPKEEIAGVTVPVKFDFNKVDSYERLEDVKRQQRERATGEYYNKKNQQLKDNFILTLQRAFNSDADSVVERLKNLPTTDFIELSLMFDEMDIKTYYYSELGGGTAVDRDRMETIHDYLDLYEAGKINMKLKNF